MTTPVAPRPGTLTLFPAIDIRDGSAVRLHAGGL